MCSTCLRVNHTRLAIKIPGSCGHCKVFTVKSLRRRLARQVSLADCDLFLHIADQGAAVEEDEDMAGEVPETGYNWVAQCEQLRAPPFPEEDVLEIGFTEDDDDASFLTSEDEEEDNTFMALAPAEKPKLPKSTTREEGGVSSLAPSLHVDLLDMYKRASEKLEVVAEPTRSSYEGKQLSLSRSGVKQLLLVFPKLLAELSISWSNCPYSNRSPVPGAASLDFEVIDAQGLLLMHPVEAPVDAHLCPGSTSQLSASSSRRAMLPTKPERPEGVQDSRPLGLSSQHPLHPQCLPGRAVWGIC